MFGVVLWSDQNDRKAVFWCEDHGDLAFYEDAADKFGAYAFFDAGDMVQFDIHMDSKLRKAQNPRIVAEKAYSELPDNLLTNSTTKSSDQGLRTAKVLPFERPAARTRSPGLRRKA